MRRGKEPRGEIEAGRNQNTKTVEGEKEKRRGKKEKTISTRLERERKSRDERTCSYWKYDDAMEAVVSKSNMKTECLLSCWG